MPSRAVSTLYQTSLVQNRGARGQNQMTPATAKAIHINNTNLTHTRDTVAGTNAANAHQIAGTA